MIAPAAVQLDQDYAELLSHDLRCYYQLKQVDMNQNFKLFCEQAASQSYYSQRMGQAEQFRHLSQIVFDMHRRHTRRLEAADHRPDANVARVLNVEKLQTSGDSRVLRDAQQ